MRTSKKRNIKYLPIILFILFTVISGCITSSQYREVSYASILSTPDTFEGKKLCTDLIYENSSFLDISVSRNQNFTGDLRNGSLVRVCGPYISGQIEPDMMYSIITIVTDKEIYYSNETLKAHVDVNSSEDISGKLTVSGIKNDFNRALINETRDESLKKGNNGFDFELKTPSCEECSALSPGVYTVNATLTVGGKTFETYKKITLQRKDENNTVKEESVQEINETQIHPDNITSLNKKVTVEYFYLVGCPKCEQASPVIESLMNLYGDRVNYVKYNAREEGRDLAIKYVIPGTPSIVIDGDSNSLISYESYNGDTEKLKSILNDAILKASISQASSIESNGQKIILSVPSVFIVGLIAGFNPCLLAILAFIASVTLATTGKRRNVLLIVLMFSLGIFMTYLIFGIGLLRILEESPGLQNNIKYFLVALIGILGLWHVYDAYHLRKNTESSFYTPKAFIRLTESVTKKVSLPASFFIGALFSLIKAPCVGAVYFLILDMVRSGEGTGYLYLASYNFGVVLPVLVLGGAIAFGLDPERVEKFRKEKRSMMRLITGVTLLAIAVLMYLGKI